MDIDVALLKCFPGKAECVKPLFFDLLEKLLKDQSFCVHVAFGWWPWQRCSCVYILREMRS